MYKTHFITSKATRQKRPMTVYTEMQVKGTELSKFELNWLEKYEALKQYKKRYGNCNVPQHWAENRSLGAWVIRQRAYRKYMHPERVEKLNNLGFIWDLYEYWWNQKYEELKTFKMFYGHCKVPKLQGKYMQLAEWVSKQRIDYHQKHQRLHEEKIRKLEQIGFYWGVINTPWQKRLSELKEFKSRFGHCNVPQLWKENPPLASWVSIQRLKHSKKVLPIDRFKILDKLGFSWKIKGHK